MGTPSASTIREAIRKRYGTIAGNEASGEDCCRCRTCSGKKGAALKDRWEAAGYSAEEMKGIPEGISQGLGCGNPKAIAMLTEGETVLDLGCGGGLDCFLAARAVGESGLVIGVDMTPEMLEKAKENAEIAGVGNVEFRLGEIERLPVGDNSVDVIISNCVINLSPEKEKTFREAFRVLRPGGRLTIMDVIAASPLPEGYKQDISLVAACVGGAETAEALQHMLEEAGFEKIEITPIEGSRRLISQLLPGHGIEDYVISSAIEAAKPLDAVSRKDDPVTKKEPPQTSEISKKTIDLFRSGYLCAEVISAAVLDSCGQMPSSLLTKCASGFCGGLGGTSKELCGAFTGGVLALSYLFGRTQPGDSLKECGELVKTFRERFLGAFGSLNCGTLLEMFQKQESPQMACVRLTAQSAGILLDLLAEFKNATGIDPLILDSLPREEVTVGQCPFS